MAWACGYKTAHNWYCTIPPSPKPYLRIETWGEPQLLDFAVQSMPLQVRVVLLFLNTLGLQLFIAAGHVARNRLSFGTGFRAFECDVVPGHGSRFTGVLKKACVDSCCP